MSLAGSYFIGNKRRGAWLWMFFTQLIWVAYGALTHQTGFIACGLGFAVMNMRNYLKWKKDDKCSGTQGEKVSSTQDTKSKRYRTLGKPDDLAHSLHPVPQSSGYRGFRVAIL